MKTGLVFFFFLRLCAHALPMNEKEDTNCITMTPEKAKEINKIGEEVNSFINYLEDKHEEIDFASIELKLENHLPDQHDKETILKIVVDDCNKNAKNHPINVDKYFENGTDSTNSQFSREFTEFSHEDVSVNEDQDDNEKTIQNNDEDDQKQDDLNNKFIKIHKSNTASSTTSETSESRINENSSRTTKSNTKNVIREDENNTTEENNMNTLNQKDVSDTHSINEEIGNNDEKADLNILDKKDNANDEISLNENFNFFGDQGTRNLYIYAPTIDNSNIEIGTYYDKFIFDLPEVQKSMDVVQEKIYNRRYAENDVPGLQTYYQNLPAQENLYNYQNYVNSDDAMNTMAFRNSKNYYNPENSFGAFGDRESEYDEGYSAFYYL